MDPASTSARDSRYTAGSTVGASGHGVGRAAAGREDGSSGQLAGHEGGGAMREDESRADESREREAAGPEAGPEASRGGAAGEVRDVGPSGEAYGRDVEDAKPGGWRSSASDARRRRRGTGGELGGPLPIVGAERRTWEPAWRLFEEVAARVDEGGYREVVPVLGTGFNAQAKRRLDWRDLLVRIASDLALPLEVPEGDALVGNTTLVWEAMLTEIARSSAQKPYLAEAELERHVCAVLRHEYPVGGATTPLARRLLGTERLRNNLSGRLAAGAAQQTPGAGVERGVFERASDGGARGGGGSAKPSRTLGNDGERDSFSLPESASAGGEAGERALRFRDVVSFNFDMGLHEVAPRWVGERGSGERERGFDPVWDHALHATAGCRVWYPHGAVKDHDSLQLGQRKYGLLIQQLERARRGHKGSEEAFRKALFPRKRRRLESSAFTAEERRTVWAAQRPHARSWVSATLSAPLVFLGLGLGREEWALWWFLNQRHRNLARSGLERWCPAFVLVHEPELPRLETAARLAGLTLLPFSTGSYDAAWERVIHAFE